jgi:hypothetical protein
MLLACTTADGGARRPPETRPLLTHRQDNLDLDIMWTYPLPMGSESGLIGVFTAVFLAILGDAMRAGSGLFKHWNLTRAMAPLAHSRTVLQQLFATRLGARAKR